MKDDPKIIDFSPPGPNPDVTEYDAKTGLYIRTVCTLDEAGQIISMSMVVPGPKPN